MVGWMGRRRRCGTPGGDETVTEPTPPPPLGPDRVWVVNRTPEQLADFQHDLAVLLNRHNMDGYCGTPDFFLAEMVVEQLTTHRKFRGLVATWEGREVKVVNP